MKKNKLSAQQIYVLSQWIKHPNEMVVTLESGYFLTGGFGIDIPKNTYWALKRMGIIGSDDRLTALGKSFSLENL